MALEQLHDLGHRELFDHDFALINPMRVRQDWWRDLPVLPLREPKFDAQPHLVPRLLPLAAVDDKQQVELLERNDCQSVETGQPMFAALLKSQASAPSLACHLGAKMLLAKRRGETVWLRFHDPRVFSALAWWLDPDQRACLLGHVQSWAWYESRDASWHVLECPLVMEPRRLTLSASQWGRLDRQLLVNRCMKELDLRPPLDDPLKNLVERIDAHLCRAAAAGLTDSADLSRFAVMAERHGDAWVRHPLAIRAVSAAAEGIQTLAAGLKELEDAGLQQRMRAGAEHMEEHA
ncbi:DUF4123 domain-containing protein [Luteimonas sp. A478]